LWRRRGNGPDAIAERQLVEPGGIQQQQRGKLVVELVGCLVELRVELVLELVLQLVIVQLVVLQLLHWIELVVVELVLELVVEQQLQQLQPAPLTPGTGAAHAAPRCLGLARPLQSRTMDWKLFATTFGLIFLAELGDKTQLATLSLAASGRSRLVVFLGSAAALAATSALAVLVGEGLSRVVPELWIRRAAGVAFLVLGVLFLIGRE
jgi:putative Ca2+/H+ antiporter (TMEM165/GDT1 family)